MTWRKATSMRPKKMDWGYPCASIPGLHKTNSIKFITPNFISRGKNRSREKSIYLSDYSFETENPLLAVTDRLEKFRQDFLQANSWQQRKDGKHISPLMNRKLTVFLLANIPACIG